jgi:hypothetical protein
LIEHLGCQGVHLSVEVHDRLATHGQMQFARFLGTEGFKQLVDVQGVDCRVLPGV